MSKDREFYMNNPSLPAKGVKHRYTPEMVNNIKKAKKNILFFAENFFHILNLDEGKQKIKLHSFQKRVLRKMRDNRFFILLASRQIGKALDINTPIPTPDGWKKMGELKQGDKVYGSDGSSCNVLYAHDVMYDRDCYEIVFCSGEKIVADSEHLWKTQTGNKLESVKTTKDIFYDINHNKNNHIINGLNGRVHNIESIQRSESVPVRCITVDSKDSLFLCGKNQIPTHNTTLLTIYSLWLACFNSDQRILVVANKEGTALEIMQRIRMAYEELPNWLKPSVERYGQTSIELVNGSRIGISTTTGTAARGQSVNCLLIDELGFIEPHLVDEFWKSVFPIISSSKKSKIFISSTANGTDNLFYKLYTGAENGENGWSCDRILWDEVPGRDEKWKQETIKAIGSEDAFDQEFGCQFLDSGQSTIDDSIFEELQERTKEPIYVFDDGSYLIWEEPKEEGIYVAGIDTAEGVGRDSSVIQILDISDLTNIKQVATYVNNKILPFNFTQKCFEILQHWGNPLACIERNNCGSQVVDNLKNLYNYENIISWGSSLAKRKTVQLGIISHTNTKYKGVTNMRYWINEMRSVEINDIECVKEMKNFIKQANGKWQARKGFHDDRVIGLMWGLIVLIEDLVKQYFDIAEYDENNRPLRIEQFDYGIKYFFNPTSIYTNEEKESAYNALPSLIGINEQGEDEIIQLQNQGWEVLKK